MERIESRILCNCLFPNSHKNLYRVRPRGRERIEKPWPHLPQLYIVAEYVHVHVLPCYEYAILYQKEREKEASGRTVSSPFHKTILSLAFALHPSSNSALFSLTLDLSLHHHGLC